MARKSIKNQIEELKPRHVAIGNATGKIVDQAELCRLYGVTRKSHDSWIEEGCPWLPHPKRAGGKMFDTAKVARWYMEWQLKKVEAKYIEVAPELNNRMDMYEAELRKKIAQALKEELSLAKEQEQVANIEDLMANFADAASNIRAALMGWKNKLPGKLAHQSEPVIADLLDREVETILNHLVNYKHDYRGAE